MQLLRQSTATALTVGPFLNTSNGSPVTGLAAPVGKLIAGTTAATFNPSGGWTELGDGYYQPSLTVAQTATAGRVRIEFPAVAPYYAVWEDADVMSAAWYDLAHAAVGSGGISGATAAGLVGADLQTAKGQPLTLDASNRPNVGVPSGAAVDVGTAGAGLTNLPTVKATDANGNALATHADALTIEANVAAITTNTVRSSLVVPTTVLLSATAAQGTVVYLDLYTALGVPEAADATPTMTVVNAAGVSRSANLSAVTSTGQTGGYAATYTPNAGDPIEELTFAAGWAVGGVAMRARTSTATGYEFVTDFTVTDRAALGAINTSVGTLATSAAVSSLAVTVGQANAGVGSLLLTAGNLSAGVLVVRANTSGGLAIATATAVAAIPTNPLTSLGPTAPVGWINPASIAPGALNGKGDWLLGSAYVVPPTAQQVAAVALGALGTPTQGVQPPQVEAGSVTDLAAELAGALAAAVPVLTEEELQAVITNTPVTTKNPYVVIRATNASVSASSR